VSGGTPVALVTGCGRREGIGYEVCRQLAARGMTVLLTARDGDRARALAAELAAAGLDVRPCALDVTDEASIRAAAIAVESGAGRLDVLVNNAAAYPKKPHPATTADVDEARRVFDVTLFGTWRVTRAFAPLLRHAPRGRIVNVSSSGGSHGDAALGLRVNASMGPAYGVSKAALNALTAKLAVELGPDGVKVNAVCPGFTATFKGAEALGARPVAEGAAGIVWAATLPDDGPTGGFFRDCTPLPW
jgi:NAD(P)-dependent dehydrogenase (short-subunit alcohol dehydrogenase family)